MRYPLDTLQLWVNRQHQQNAPVLHPHTHVVLHIHTHSSTHCAQCVLSNQAQLSDSCGLSTCAGLRGAAALEVTVETAAADMHSGMKGGSVQNANHALIQLLSGLWDRPRQVSRVRALPLQI